MASTRLISCTMTLLVAMNAMAAHAQTSPDPSGAMFNTGSQISAGIASDIGSRGLIADGGEASSAAKPLSKSQSSRRFAKTSAALSDQPSAAVSSHVRLPLADDIARADPAQAAQIRGVLSTDALWQSFSHLIAGFGCSSTNLADVMTAYCIINREVVSGEDATRNRAAIQAVHDQLAAALLANPRVPQLSDADKHCSAEVMGTLAAVAGGAENELLGSGDRAGLFRLRESVHQAVLGQGVALRRIRLTADGFVPT